MNRTASIVSIVKKDLVQISRNRFISIISIMLIVVLAVVYNLMSSEVDESFKLGLSLAAGSTESGETMEAGVAEKLAEKFSGQAGQESNQALEGLEITFADSVEELRRMVEDEEVVAGLFLDLTGEEPRGVLYVSSVTPAEAEEASQALGREIVYAVAGYPPPVDFKVATAGPDMVGMQVPLRDKLRVMLLSFIFLMELYGLANLLMEEIQRKTALAVLTTPVTLGDFISAKAATGVIMAFSQGLLLALLLGAISRDTWLPLLVFLLLGAGLMVGVAFIMGALSSDFISMAMISMIPFMVLMLPGFALLYPGFSSTWLKVIPTWYLVDPLNGILNYGMGLPDYLTSVLALLLYAAGFFLLGFLILRRRLA